MDLERRRQTSNRKTTKDREHVEETQQLPGSKAHNKKFSSVSGSNNYDDSPTSQGTKGLL